MKIKCTNKKEFKNLTLDKEYELVNEEGNFYYIINDAKLETRYSKELFTVIPETIDFNMDNVRIVVQAGIDNNREITIHYNINGTLNLVVNFTIGGIVVNTTDISCGIYQLPGLNNICSNLIEKRLDLERAFVRLNVTNVQPVYILHILTNLIFKEYIKKTVEANNVKFFLLSTNVTNNNYFENENYSFESVLDELSSTVEEGRNPNSGNQIKLWTIKKE